MSTQVTNLNVVKFPLVKFSHHLGPNGTKSHTWTHVNYRNDLELVLRDIPVVDDFGNHEIRSWMKVIGGSEILVKISHIEYSRYFWHLILLRNLKIFLNLQFLARNIHL